MHFSLLASFYLWLAILEGFADLDLYVSVLRQTVATNCSAQAIYTEKNHLKRGCIEQRRGKRKALLDLAPKNADKH
jgi:hypothetical protein